MASRKLGYTLALATPLGLGGCGFGVPEMNVFFPDGADSGGIYSTEGDFENDLLFHIRCSIGKGLWSVKRENIEFAKYLYSDKWGTSINLSLQVDEMSGLNSTLGTTNQYGNVVKAIPHGSATYPQEILFGLGATGTAHTTRQVTVNFTYSNADLLASEEFSRKSGSPDGLDCNQGMNGFQIQSNLKIDQFIWDQASLRSFGTAGPQKQNPFGVAQEQLTFVMTYGANVTPTWHISTVVVNTASPFLSASRSETDTLIITLGPLQPNSNPLALQAAAQSQHTAATTGVATAASTKASQ